MANHPTLKTLRLKLRPLTVADADVLFPVFSNPETMWFFGEVHRSIDETRGLFEAFIQGEYAANSRQWTICLKAGQVIGSLSIHGVEDAIAQMGFILHADYQGYGYATEAVRSAVDYAFTDWGLHRLFLNIDPNNIPSQRIAQKLGFTLEGHLRQSFYLRGIYLDELVYGLLVSEWTPSAKEPTTDKRSSFELI
ncbi:MAG: GNAT family N-acetyltransferase [Kastovskya adunca ATA6-11-RM4]|jgi:RimJ/RimL family protein N-acetyltransferase|nr:GNAT family N-acetyltransferase [Kastovskya adunca ATA6-11-RM4]